MYNKRITSNNVMVIVIQEESNTKPNKKIKTKVSESTTKREKTRERNYKNTSLHRESLSWIHMASLPLAPHQTHNPPPDSRPTTNKPLPSSQQHSMSDDKVLLSLYLNFFIFCFIFWRSTTSFTVNICGFFSSCYGLNFMRAILGIVWFGVKHFHG